MSDPVCAPLCGAAKAYGRFDQPWKHDSLCPVRLAWIAERQAPLHGLAAAQEQAEPEHEWVGAINRELNAALVKRNEELAAARQQR